MKQITHEGSDYILKTEVDKIISERLSKTADRARAAESRIADLESTLKDSKEKIGQVDTLTAQLHTMSEDLTAARQQYSQHSTISSHGITDPEIREAVLWSFDRTMSGLPKKDRQNLDSWLQTLRQDPSTAPAVLRPHFAQPADQQPAPQQQQQQQHQHLRPPPSNNGVEPASTPVSDDLLSRASDPNFYRQNRQKIREAYYAKRGGKPSNW